MIAGSGVLSAGSAGLHPVRATSPTRQPGRYGAAEAPGNLNGQEMDVTWPVADTSLG